MKLHIAAIVTVLASSPAIAQINATGIDDSIKPFFAKANDCLKSFDIKAKEKRLSPDLYKTALEGSCVKEISSMRALYSLHLERSPNQKYHLERLDKDIIDARASMVTSYVMR